MAGPLDLLRTGVGRYPARWAGLCECLASLGRKTSSSHQSIIDLKIPTNAESATSQLVRSQASSGRGIFSRKIFVAKLNGRDYCHCRTVPSISSAPIERFSSHRHFLKDLPMRLYRWFADSCYRLAASIITPPPSTQTPQCREYGAVHR